MAKKIGIFILVVTFVFSGSILYAKKKGDTAKPSGWSKGEKKGWQTDTPPDSTKKEQEKKGRKEQKTGEKKRYLDTSESRQKKEPKNQVIERKNREKIKNAQQQMQLELEKQIQKELEQKKIGR